MIKDGLLLVNDDAGLTGVNVGFYMTGQGAAFQFLSRSRISLTAPKDGPMAGILFFGDRHASSTQEYIVTSDNARVLLGTIYIPRGILKIDANTSVAEDSPWTAIVADQLNLLKRANMVLRTDYGLTDVPVPKGLGPAKSVRLVQ